MNEAALDHLSHASKTLPDWLRLYSKIVCVLTGLLIFVGALVTSHDAGLSVPDWPTTYGQNMFTFPYEMWLGGIFYEHGHRLFASGIGFLILLLALFAYFYEPRAWVRNLSYLALGAVIIQGLLGGLTVLFGLPDAISVSHAVLGQSLFVLTLTIAWAQSKEYEHKPILTTSEQALSGLAIFTALTVFLELIVGAMMRHSASGLAVPDFPTMGAAYSPFIDETRLFLINEMRRGLGLTNVSYYQVSIHLLHRGVAVLVTCSVFALYIKSVMLISPKSLVRAGARLLAMIVILQFTLGATTVLTQRHPLVASAHVFFGAVTLGVAVLVALRGGVSGRRSV